MLQRHARALVHATGALVLISVQVERCHAQEGGIEVFAAETLFAEGWRISESYLYKRKGNVYRGSDRVRDPQDRLFEEHRSVTGVDYGLLPSLTLSALLPVVYKQQRQRTGGRKETLESFGLGDIALLGKYRVYKNDWKRGAFHLALIGGLEFPTGDTDADEDGSRLPPALQPGSGSWDPVAAVAANLNLNRLRFDGLFFYKVNTEGAQDFADGDFLAVEGDVAYRFWHTKYPGPTASARLGVQWRHEGRDELDGRTVSNSGSDEILLRPGLTFHPIPSMDLTLSIDVPVYRDFNGEQLGLDLRTFLALGFRF